MPLNGNIVAIHMQNVAYKFVIDRRPDKMRFLPRVAIITDIDHHSRAPLQKAMSILNYVCDGLSNGNELAVGLLSRTIMEFHMWLNPVLDRSSRCKRLQVVDDGAEFVEEAGRSIGVAPILSFLLAATDGEPRIDFPSNISMRPICVTVGDDWLIQDRGMTDAF